MVNIEMSIDHIQANVINNMRAIVLKEKNGNRYLLCWMGPAEADAIAVKLQGVFVPRPLTHDFVCTIIDSLKGVVKEAILNKLVNETYYAKLVIISNEKEIEIDCRPSDAIAVAVCLDKPIFADERVLEKAGIALDSETNKTSTQSIQEKSILSGNTTIESTRTQIFSMSSQDIMSLAENESKRFNHISINTGHLLIALLKETSLATEILKNIGVNLPELLKQVETSITDHSGIEGDEHGLTSAIKTTIKLSIEEAKCLGNNEVNPEHILIGLLRQDDGLATKLLKDLNISHEKIYIELIKLYTRHLLR